MTGTENAADGWPAHGNAPKQPSCAAYLLVARCMVLATAVEGVSHRSKLPGAPARAFQIFALRARSLHVDTDGTAAERRSKTPEGDL